ncbi:MAG: hypothetical protein DMG51_05965 [Acidobacteria bacterium]|nr:MAG: hypothetical protein DMG51_05965 [Acidobacteriota bacterium]
MPSLANLDFGEMIATARNDNFQAFKILTIILRFRIGCLWPPVREDSTAKYIEITARQNQL